MTRDETLIAAFADELRFRRAALRLSQEELAHRAGINRTYIAKLELARNQPTLTVLFRIPILRFCLGDGIEGLICLLGPRAIRHYGGHGRVSLALAWALGVCRRCIRRMVWL